MIGPFEKILVVESDPDISDVIVRQALQPLGYDIRLVNDGGSAILQAAKFGPDLIVANVNLPGLSGKDLLVALTSQDVQVPVIVLAQKGQEHDVIQAFRLGATDYLIWPARDAEVVSAVERVLKQVREGRASQRLDQQLKAANQELQHRVRELTTIFAVGKAVISITNQRELFDKIVEGTVYVAEADYAWFLVRDDNSRSFTLAAHHKLPEGWAKKIGQPLDDGISSLVAMSGETLAINGEPLQRFKVSALGQSAMVVPVKAQQEVIGLLVVVRKTDRPFDRNMQTLLEAVADYASISMINARLFRALQEAAEAAKAGESRKRDQLTELRTELQSQLQPATYPLEVLLSSKMGKLTAEQTQALHAIQVALQRALQLVNVDSPSQPISPSGVK
jgi:DNA-binding response OmpR family regulator